MTEEENVIRERKGEAKTLFAAAGNPAKEQLGTPFREAGKTADGARETGDPAERRAEGKNAAILGKFRSVDALAEAYAALQAEFTRRSQRLKELEKKTENSVSRGDPESGGIPEEKTLGEERLRKADGGEGESPENSRSQSDAQGESADGNRGSANAQAGRVGDSEEREPVFAPDGAVNAGNGGSFALKKTGAAVAGAEQKRETADGGSYGEPNDEEALYRAATASENVRLRIVGDYLSSLKKGAPLMRGGTGTLAVPALKAKSISDAGELALRYFKKDIQA